LRSSMNAGGALWNAVAWKASPSCCARWTPPFRLNVSSGSMPAPVVLVNVFTLDKADEQTFLKAWQDDALFMKQQSGFISTQLHRAIGGWCRSLSPLRSPRRSASAHVVQQVTSRETILQERQKHRDQNHPSSRRRARDLYDCNLLALDGSHRAVRVQVVVTTVKTAIPWGFLLLIPALAAAGGSGLALAKGRRAGLIGAKVKRMPLIAANGILVLIPAALFLASKARVVEFDTSFYAVQALELVAGAANITLFDTRVERLVGFVLPQWAV
jgi:hypothetical protein